MGRIIHMQPTTYASDDAQRKIDASLVDYVDILFNLMGVDITYEKFQAMSKSERIQFVRDLKINKIVNE